MTKEKTTAAQRREANSLFKALARQAVTPDLHAKKVEDFCTVFNTVVAPALDAAGIEKSFHAKMGIFMGEKLCVIRSKDSKDDTAPDEVVATYSRNRAQMDKRQVNKILAEKIINTLTPQDQEKIARFVPDFSPR